MSYAVPGNELSLADRKAYLLKAQTDGINRAKDKLGVQERELVVREAHPGTERERS